ncbi:Adenosylcobalamin biosynthesis, ATP:cob(I)alamin adenosyltransferase-like protein [Syncephalis plumigaleata]|nr:Adenosylcobalamin biosynthesis, ATP:cob(I)alamin adenosyltransferase-like protein [Syncephalis plumigaleata]
MEITHSNIPIARVSSGYFCSRRELHSLPDRELPTMKVYTRTGDKGTSALYSGERRPKEDAIFEALGTTDELSCHIGLAREYSKEQGISAKHLDQLDLIQCMLQDIGSSIATPRDARNRARVERTQFDPDGEAVKQLEEWIDEMAGELPPLRQFILPVIRWIASAQLHVARATCRRAERRVVPLVNADSTEASVSKYLNRLSDFLFMAARYTAMKGGHKEAIYKDRSKSASQ